MLNTLCLNRLLVGASVAFVVFVLPGTKQNKAMIFSNIVYVSLSNFEFFLALKTNPVTLYLHQSYDKGRLDGFYKHSERGLQRTDLG